MTWKQRRVHAEDTVASELDEGIAHELRPADDEDQVGVEQSHGRKGLVGVHVAGLVEFSSEALRNVVEGALPRSVRVDRAGV